MCISNGLDAGLISNAVWKGVPMHDLLDPAVPLSNSARVRLFGVDNYSDTIPLEKALDGTTLVAYEMNGAPLLHRHGYPARVIVPGYFGEKHVKWLTRIEVATADAKGFYENQSLRKMGCDLVPIPGRRPRHRSRERRSCNRPVHRASSRSARSIATRRDRRRRSKCWLHPTFFRHQN